MAFKAFNFMRGEQVFAAAIVAAMGLFASPAWAACTSTSATSCTTTSMAVVVDSTKIEAYKLNTFQDTYSNNGFNSGVGDVLQQPGTAFNTDRLIATITQSRHNTTLELQYYTSFNGSDSGVHYADIFLSNYTSTPNAFEYGIALGKQASNDGLSTPGFYNVTSGTTYMSREIWSQKSGTYGGKFQGTDGNWYDSPTVVDNNATKFVAQNAPVTTATFGSATTAEINAGFPYLVDVKLTLSNTDFNALFGGGLSVFWGTADCSNDAILAYIPLSIRTVPEPLTLSLFSAGVVGVAAMRRRRKSKG